MSSNSFYSKFTGHHKPEGNTFQNHALIAFVILIVFVAILFILNLYKLDLTETEIPAF